MPLPAHPSVPRNRIPRVLLAIAATAAAVAAVGAVPQALDAAPATALTAWWRTYGLAVFAGVFALLAVDPARHTALWLLAIAHKLAMTVTALALPAAAGATTILLADGALTVLLLTAFALTRLPRRSAAEPGQTR